LAQTKKLFKTARVFKLKKNFTTPPPTKYLARGDWGTKGVSYKKLKISLRLRP